MYAAKRTGGTFELYRRGWSPPTAQRQHELTASAVSAA
jgi:hypothetical protein